MFDIDGAPETLTVIWYVGTEEVCAGAVPNPDGTTSCDVVIGTDERVISLEVRDAENAAGIDRLEFTVIPTGATAEEVQPADP